MKEVTLTVRSLQFATPIQFKDLFVQIKFDKVIYQTATCKE
jgi:hypothetical protein